MSDDYEDFRYSDRRNGAANPHYRAEPLGVIDPCSWHDQPVPPREWLVSGWMPHRNVTLFNSDGGLGKSSLAQMLATSTAVGRAWLGLQTRSVKAIYFACEDDRDELQRRQADINRHKDVGMLDLENLRLVERVGKDNSLISPGKYDEAGEPTDVYYQFLNAAEDLGAQLIVLDSLHDLFAGNENARPQARRFIGMLRKMAIDLNATVLLLAHPSASGLQSGSGTAGSTAWNNAVRSRLYMTRDDSEEDPDENLRILRRKKANYAGLGEGLKLRWQNGVFIREHDSFTNGIERSARQKEDEDAFLRCLDAHLKTGRPASPSPHSQTFAPKIFTRMKEAKGISKKRLETAMEGLLSQNRIAVGEIRTSGRKLRESLVRKDLVNP